MSGSSLNIVQILNLHSAGPTQIVKLTSDLTETQLHAAPRPGEWSANEVLAHLRSCADVWGDCIMTILNEDNPTIRAVNPRTWIGNTNYLEQDFRPSLQAFTVQRSELLSILEPLKPKSWLRPAIVTGAGKPLTRTVQTYAEWIAIHERPHLKQLRRITGMVLMI